MALKLAKSHLGLTLYIVVQRHWYGESEKIFLLVYLLARRFTRFISVPTANLEPSGAFLIVSMI